MKVLIVCPYFPPENVIAALRVGKFAQHLAEDGASVRVVTRKAVERGLSPVDTAGKDLHIVRSLDPLASVKMRFANKGKYRLGARGRTKVDPGAQRTIRESLIDRVASVTRSLFFVPDPFVFWCLGAVAMRGLGGWKPDVVLASAGPMSSFLVGAAAAARFKVPWVADYRDLLSIGPYYERGYVRRVFDRWLERKVVGTASALTTVSRPLAGELRSFLGAEATVVLNGFDPAEFAAISPSGSASSDLVLTYCGEIYFGKRDPSGLFNAVRSLMEEGVPVTVNFYGGNSDYFEAWARKFGVGDRVVAHPRVTHEESLRVQATSDVLLQLMWNDPREVGVYTGKLFEYIGARRPILLMGYPNGVAAELVRERGLGVVANDAESIAEALREWAREKRDNGTITPLPSCKQRGLTRRDQSNVMEQVLIDVITRTASTPRHAPVG